MTKVILTSLFCICGTILLGQISAADLVSKSMSYHDPGGQLAKEQFTLKLLETRPNGADRSTKVYICLLYTSPSPRDQRGSRMPSSA